MVIIEYAEQYADALADIFHGSVHAIPEELYSPAQKEAWAPSPVDYERWRGKFRKSRPFVAVDGGSPAGFIELEEDGHIDCFYVAPSYQGTGVGTGLYSYAEDKARKRGLRELTVEASKAAAPFFSRREFVTLAENHVPLRGEILVNYRMRKVL